MLNDAKWSRVTEAVMRADSIAWDGCHKIYVLMDHQQTAEMRDCGYDPLHEIKSIGTNRALELLREWYDDSCSLRFINSARTVEGDPNDGIEDLID